MKLFTFRKPVLRISKSGIHLSPGSIRIGGKGFGINVSKSGVSESIKTPLGTYNTKRGLRISLWPWGKKGK